MFDPRAPIPRILPGEWQPEVPLVRGGIYVVTSRNLLVGVFDGQNGMVGIRLKMGYCYLDTEILYSAGGTVRRVVKQVGSLIYGIYPDETDPLLSIALEPYWEAEYTATPIETLGMWA